MGIKKTTGTVGKDSSKPISQVAPQNDSEEGLEFSQPSLTGEEEIEKNEAEVARQASGRKTGKENREEMRARRDEFVKNSFDPTHVDFLKEKFGIDVYMLPLSTVRDIAGGNLTEPLSMKVTPIVYDRVNKMNVAAAPIDIIASMRFVFPHRYVDGKYVPAAIGSKNDEGKDFGVYFESAPCYPYVKSTFYPEKKEYSGEAAQVNFTEAQMTALEGIGIENDALFAGNYNSIDQDQKKLMVEGKPFDVVGHVNIDTGMKSEKGNMITRAVKVAGRGQLINTASGVKAVFDSNYNMKRMKNQILDLTTIKTTGNVTLDLYTRDDQGKIVRKGGLPLMNESAEQLIKYGRAFGAVLGIKHIREWDAEAGQFIKRKETGRYQVSVVNGGLYATEMVKVPDKDINGNLVTYTAQDGSVKERYHYEVKFPHINEKNGTVRIGYQDLKPVSERDLENYRRGRGGFFADFEMKDADGKVTSKREVFAVADNQRNGFSTFYSEKATQMIKEDIKAGMGKVQNFQRKSGLSR